MAEAATSGVDDVADDASAVDRPTMVGFDWLPRPELPDPPERQSRRMT
jgi:hypothetical protein